MLVFYIILFIVILLAILYIFSTRCRKGHPGLAELRGWAYAHRGLHGSGVPENSLEAFRLAVKAGYGSELDVHLLADGNLAVIHDSTLKRTTGADGCNEELNADQLTNYRLEETTEVIPLFEEVLGIYEGKAPLIVELKPVANNHAALCTRVCQALDSYKGAYCIESFDPRCVHWFKKHRPDIIRGPLTQNFLLSKSSKLPWFIKLAMRIQLVNFLILPDFVAYKYADRIHFSNFLARKLWGAQGVTWTITSQEDFDIAVTEGWIPIFENFRP